MMDLKYFFCGIIQKFDFTIRLISDPGTMWYCQIDDPGPGMKGMHLWLPQTGFTVTLEEGELLSIPFASPWLLNVGPSGLDVHLAIGGESGLVTEAGVLFYVHLDEPLELSGALIDVRGPGNLHLDSEVVITGIEGQVPTGLAPEMMAHPNPFNPSTMIIYNLAGGSDVRLDIYDVRGNHVCSLVREWQEPGQRVEAWTGTDEGGRDVPAGTYVCRLITKWGTESLKVSLVK